MKGKEVVWDGNGIMSDGDEIMGIEIVKKRMKVFRRRKIVMVKVNDKEGRREGWEEWKIIGVRLRRERNKELDLREENKKMNENKWEERI